MVDCVETIPINITLPSPFVGQGNTPDPYSVTQAYWCTADCWFIAAVVGLARQRPEDLKALIRPFSRNCYSVTLFGQKPILVPVDEDGESWSRSNGSWSSLLERAYGQYLCATGWRRSTPGSRMGRCGFPSEGIHALTGRRVDTDWLWWTRLRTTRRKLQKALSHRCVVTAVTGWRKRKVQSRHLIAKHVYTVLDYDSATDRVQLRNPWGFGRGHDAGEVPPDGEDDGIFWMSLREFTRSFFLISYEQER